MSEKEPPPPNGEEDEIIELEQVRRDRLRRESSDHLVDRLSIPDEWWERLARPPEIKPLERELIDYTEFLINLSLTDWLTIKQSVIDQLRSVGLKANLYDVDDELNLVTEFLSGLELKKWRRVRSSLLKTKRQLELK